MIKRVLAAVLGSFGLCLPLLAQQADHSQPVDTETITLEQLESTGAIDVAPALALYQPNSFSSADSSILIYGFPTLTLLDGRRFSISGAFGRLQPNDVIPMAFLHSVDVQRINSSAVYGTDSPGGVVDLRVNRYNVGGEFGFFYGKSSGKFGYEVKSAYILGGVGNDKVQITAGAAYEEASGHLPSLSH